MKKLPVENIENEMVLAKDVTGTTGNALLGAGTKLTASMGRRLKNWGVTIVYIEGDDENSEEMSKEESSPEKNRELLVERFEGVLENNNMNILFNAVLDFQNSN